MCLTFQMMTLVKYLTKNVEIFLGGIPILSKNDHSSTSFYTLFISNPVLLKKCGYLQKNRGLSVDLTEI